MIKRLKGFFKDKRPAFFVALGAAFLAFASAIVYIALFAGEKLLSVPVFLFALLSFLPFLVLAFFGMPRTGSAVMAGMVFAAFVFFLSGSFQYIYDQINYFVMSKKFEPQFWSCVTTLVMLLVTAILANVCAWLPQNKGAKGESYVG